METAVNSLDVVKVKFVIQIRDCWANNELLSPRKIALFCSLVFDLRPLDV